MSISLFVAATPLTDKHYPVKSNDGLTVYVRAYTPIGNEHAGEHPMHAAKNSHDRCLPGEIFLNAINDPKAGKAYEAGYKWKRGNAAADPLDAPGT